MGAIVFRVSPDDVKRVAAIWEVLEQNGVDSPPAGYFRCVDAHGELTGMVVLMIHGREDGTLDGEGMDLILAVRAMPEVHTIKIVCCYPTAVRRLWGRDTVGNAVVGYWDGPTCGHISIKNGKAHVYAHEADRPCFIL